MAIDKAGLEDARWPATDEGPSAKRRARRAPPPKAGTASQPWGPRRVGAAVLKLATRLLFGARLSDVAASLKAFSTELLRKLDLQCERFEFGSEVTAKLCRAGEKIVEVPIHYERRVARSSWPMDRFARRPAADSRAWIRPKARQETSLGGRAAGPGYVMEVAALVAGGSRSGQDTRRGAGRRRAEGDGRRNGLCRPRCRPRPLGGRRRGPIGFRRGGVERPRPAAEEAAAGSVEAEAVASLPTPGGVGSLRRRMRRRGVRSSPGCFGSGLSAHRRLPRSPTSLQDEESSKDLDWEHWGLTDLMLLLAIVNIGLVLLVTMVAPFSSWSGLVSGGAGVGGDVSHDPRREDQARQCNQAFAVLAVLLDLPDVP